MATFLTLQEFEQLAPVQIGDYNNTIFNPIANIAANDIIAKLPLQMQPMVKAQDFRATPAFKALPVLAQNKQFQDLPDNTPLPELQAFWVEWGKAWLALEVARGFQAQTAKTTTEGARVYTEQYSNTGTEKQKSESGEYFGIHIQKAATRLFGTWRGQNYVFDGVGYPPSYNMDSNYWFSTMGNYNFGFYTGYGWGWWGNGGYMANINLTSNTSFKLDIL
jgi:hypothetical protein